MVRPTFIVIGAMKAGTTSLHAYLGRHPQVFTTAVKELDFFVPRMNWEQGWSWYESHFEPGRDLPARGESSPSYTMAPALDGPAGLIGEHLPGVRLVYLVRDPLERIRSMYLHALTKGLESRPMETVVRRERGYVDASRYGFQLERYLRHLHAEQVLVIKSEDLRDNREAVLATVFRHIGVDPGLAAPGTDVERHRTAEKRVPRAVDRVVARIRGLRRLRTLPPDHPAGRAYRRVATREWDPVEARLGDRLRRWILEEFLLEDLTRLRGHLGADFDAWGLLPE